MSPSMEDLILDDAAAAFFLQIPSDLETPHTETWLVPLYEGPPIGGLANTKALSTITGGIDGLLAAPKEASSQPGSLDLDQLLEEYGYNTSTSLVVPRNPNDSHKTQNFRGSVPAREATARYLQDCTVIRRFLIFL